MTLAELTNFIQATGFPIFVALVLLWRVDQMHADNLRAIAALTLALNDLRAELAHRREGP